MITGEQHRTVMGRAFEAGVEFFLFKPVELLVIGPLKDAASPPTGFDGAGLGLE